MGFALDNEFTVYERTRFAWNRKKLLAHLWRMALDEDDAYLADEMLGYYQNAKDELDYLYELPSGSAGRAD